MTNITGLYRRFRSVSCQLAGQSGVPITRCASFTKRLSYGQHDSGRRCSVLVAVSALFSAALPVWAQESSEIAKQAQNPIASFISVPFENDLNARTGINKQDSYVLEMKPVVPFNLSNDWNLITRTIIPVIQVPELAPGVDGTTGVGDIQLSLFLSPARAGAVIWGAGPVVSFPSASQEILGTKKLRLSVGPTVVVVRIQGHWLFGALVQNLFSVAGPSARANVNQMLMQPFGKYNLN